MTQIELTGDLVEDTPKLGRKRDHTRDPEILDAALEILAETGYDAMTIDMIAARAKAGKATLYRAVAALESSGWLERIGERGGSALFARCAGGVRHHHHVVCADCGRVAAVRCPGVGKATPPGRHQGFLVTRHEVTLHGLCANCRPSHDAEA